MLSFAMVAVRCHRSGSLKLMGSRLQNWRNTFLKVRTPDRRIPMDVNRRNLMKGILAGGTLATFGIPRLTTAGMDPGSDTVKTRTCTLLLGNTPVDDAFANGVSAAYSVSSAAVSSTSAPPATLEVVKLKSGLLVKVRQVSELLATSRGMRWVAVMDDASAAVFTEIVRTAGGRLLSRGTH